jgi:hypothetical protein
VALSRALLGSTLFAYHVVPALAGAGTLVFACLVTKEFGGKTFAVVVSALAFLINPTWLGVDSIFGYDSIDLLVLSIFIYVLVRLLRTGNRRLWIALGLIAGLACNTKMTILFMGPGFLLALLLSDRRRDLLTGWPWLGALICVVMVIPYLLWQIHNGWPTLEYWTRYESGRVYRGTLGEYFVNIVIYSNRYLVPLWLAGLYRLFRRRMNGMSAVFLAVLFLGTLALMFIVHAPARLLAAVFIPLFAAGAVLVEEMLIGLYWERRLRTATLVVLVLLGIVSAPLSLPLVPEDKLDAFAGTFNFLYTPLKDFQGGTGFYPPLIAGRLGWEQAVKEVARVYDGLPAEDKAVAGIFADSYGPAGAVDLLGEKYGLPHAVSGNLTYYLWGPGYSWELMLIVTNGQNEEAVLFEACELKGAANEGLGLPSSLNIYVCRGPKVPAETIWKGMKYYR